MDDSKITTEDLVRKISDSLVALTQKSPAERDREMIKHYRASLPDWAEECERGLQESTSPNQSDPHFNLYLMGLRGLTETLSEGDLSVLIHRLKSGGALHLHDRIAIVSLLESNLNGYRLEIKRDAGGRPPLNSTQKLAHQYRELLIVREMLLNRAYERGHMARAIHTVKQTYEGLTDEQIRSAWKNKRRAAVGRIKRKKWSSLHCFKDISSMVKDNGGFLLSEDDFENWTPETPITQLDIAEQMFEDVLAEIDVFQSTPT